MALPIKSDAPTVDKFTIPPATQGPSMPTETHTILIANMQPHLALAMDHIARSAATAQTFIAGNSIEATEIAIDQRPTLAILDIGLLPVDGYGLAHLIRENWRKHNHHAEIWLSVGRLDEPDPDLTAQSTADRIIRHPFDPNMLAGLIRHALSQPARH